jgi:hypothetical protein
MRETDLNSIEHELRKLEESLLRPEVRRDSVACARLLADDFSEFGSSGTIFTKSQILQALEKEALKTEALNTEPPTHFSIDDFRVRIVAPDAALVTYRATRRSETERSPSASSSVSLRSSRWVLRDSRWQILFHQGTKIEVQTDED